VKKVLVFALTAIAAVFAFVFDAVGSATDLVSLAMVPAVISDDFMRYGWELIKSEMGRYSPEVQSQIAKAFEDWRIQPGVLRLEKAVNASATSYQFPVLGEDGTTSLTEKRLNRSDTFFVVKHGVLLGLRNTDEPSRMKLFSYNSPAFQNAIGTAGLTADLLAIYNGSLEIALDQKQVIQNFDLNMFLHRPDGCHQDGAGKILQSTELVDTTTTYVYEPDLYQDSGSPLAGLQKVTPLLNFNGTAKNKITVNFPKEAGISFAPANNNEIVLVYYAVGFTLAGVNVNL
jgi:hypothetical protein